MRSLLVCLLSILLLSEAVEARQKRSVTDAEVLKVHRSAILVDTHNDVTSLTVDGLDIGPLRKSGHTDVARLKQGGVGAVFFAAYVSGTYVDGNHSANRTLEMIDTIRHDIVAKHPADFELVTTADGIVAAQKRGKIAALIGIEGGHAIEDSLRLLRDYYALGVRYMTLTHSNSNNWADSSGDYRQPNKGLNELGKKVVAEMNRLGMMVDISHVADSTFWDALEVSKAPIFASHSSCRAISPNPRNMTDDMIKALAKKGGVVQINFGCAFVNPAAVSKATVDLVLREKIQGATEALKGKPEAERTAELRKLQGPPGPRPSASLEDVVININHVADIAGVDAIGIGSDYDGVTCVPTGLEDVSKFPALTKRLLEEGYSAEEVRKIYGGNLLRVMKAVEAAAIPARRPL